MIWFYTRDQESLRLETRYDNEASEYVLEVRAPGVPPTSERFRNAAAFQKRLIEIEDGLGGQKWKRSGPPLVLPDGWPDRTPLQ